MTVRRSGALLAAAALLALGACQPRLPVPVASSPAPPGAGISVSSTTLTQSDVLLVEATGCDDDLQYVEIRLVAGVADSRESVAVVAGWAGEPTSVEVPAWMPAGPGSVEASCLEPDTSHSSDGADFERFTYAPVPVSVTSDPTVAAPVLAVSSEATGGVLHVSGSGCVGRVLVRVARGPWLVGSAAGFHYGATLVDAGADGAWSADIALRYSVGEFSGPVAPGAMTAFAVCDGWWYRPAPFRVVGSAPAVELVGSSPSLLHLPQCPTQNQIGVIGVVELVDGSETFVSTTRAGGGYGETLVEVAVPADAKSITWLAGCNGDYEPTFNYRSARWEG